MTNVLPFKPELGPNDGKPGEASGPLTADEAFTRDYMFKRDNIEVEAFMRQKGEALRGEAPTRVECEPEIATTCDWCNRKALRHNPLLRCRVVSEDEDAVEFVHVACWPFWFGHQHSWAVAALEKAGLEVRQRP